MGLGDHRTVSPVRLRAGDLAAKDRDLVPQAIREAAEVYRELAAARPDAFGRDLAMSDNTRHHVDLFWDLVDQILNAVLFTVLGMEFIIVEFSPGLVVAAADLLTRTPDPSEDEIREALSGNLCRCTGYGRILAAVEAVVATREGRRPTS